MSLIGWVSGAVREALPIGNIPPDEFNGVLIACWQRFANSSAPFDKLRTAQGKASLIALLLEPLFHGVSRTRERRPPFHKKDIDFLKISDFLNLLFLLIYQKNNIQEFLSYL
jgi:hypothetical protein